METWKEMYRKKLGLIFLDLDITLSNDKISTKFYDKRDNFSFLVYACQASIATFQHLFYGTIIYKTLCIARSFSSVISFCEKISALIKRIEKQGGNRRKLI